ncbi:glycine cleavage system aminomethyltransferase GcvT [Ectothiorhodospiraceae bacterium WFHF3C12]|nr:glycine cleavage system aminomethyltransferase GcvT [Ectothiorhodospiraceae bacterium WFHF3C12]
MGNRTSLYDAHREAEAKIVDFAGYDMPLHYGSQIKEHRIVREDAGMFDVSHMCPTDVTGAGAQDYLRRLLANDVAKLAEPGKALYSCMLDERGGVIDDLIVYFLAPERYRVVLNAATREKDLAWMRRQTAGFDVAIEPRDELAMIAVQGPNARDKALTALPAPVAQAARDLGVFYASEADGFFVARTGYTGEDGFEIMLPNDEAPAFFAALQQAGVSPCGLGARDTLRLEAGMNLYGQDMDETTTPLEVGLKWTVAFEPEERDFIGRDALAKQREQGPARKMIGLVLEERGVLRPHQSVHDGELSGEITSGSFSPTLGKSIALALVPAGFGDSCQAEVRGKLLPARTVKPPFVRNGKARI